MTTESENKLKEIMKEYNILDGIIQDLGKFEGEPAYVPYFYNWMLDGCGTSFLIEPEDHQMFDIPTIYDWVTVLESNDGFVSCEFSEFEPEDEEEIVEWDDIYIPYMEDEEF